MSIRVVAPGALTTVQDLGRPGYGAAGVPPSGAMDELSLRTANLLAGNDEGAAALEITMRGPDLLFEAEHVVGIAGAPFPVRLNGDPVDVRRTFLIPAGATLSLGSAPSGVRCYLAVRGGIDVPRVLGSRSTCVAAGFGGLGGRPLDAGDRVSIGAATRAIRRCALASDVVQPVREPVLRVVLGPQDSAFAEPAVEAFLSSAYRVSPRSDRAGVRLEGAPLEHRAPADLDPEGVVTGAVQVPAGGDPIALGPDRPATGGYVKIATVVAADLPLLAQARPGDTLRFAEISVDEARAAWRSRIAKLHGAVEELG